jgi:hypothetical protein
MQHCDTSVTPKVGKRTVTESRGIRVGKRII